MLNALRDRKPRTPGDQEAGSTAEKAENTGSKIPEGPATGRNRSFPVRPTMSQTGSPQSITDQLGMVARHAASIQSGPSTPASDSEAVNQKLTVGRGINIKGTISDADSIAVEGHLEATCMSRDMQILECGTFSGDAELETADISGCFEGNLTVTDRLLIRSSGYVSGVIRYCSIEIEAGGQIAGDVQVSEPPVIETPPEPEPQPEPEPEAQTAPPPKAEKAPKIEKPAPEAKAEAKEEKAADETPETE